MSGGRDNIGREHLPIPDRPFAGLVTYDAKDPATSFPPIEPLRPPSITTRSGWAGSPRTPSSR
jgi:hypothetical protein